METLPEIIGVAGTNGSGKDTLARLRFERQNARNVSLSDILRIEADRRGVSRERENLSAISTEWGRKFGAGALAVMTIQEFRETRTATEPGLSITSVRRPAEAAVIRDEGGAIIWIDADREGRYQRILDRQEGRSEDFISYEEFCANEEKEMHPASNDPAELNMAGVRDMADIHLRSEFESGDHFKKYLIERFSL